MKTAASFAGFVGFAAAWGGWNNVGSFSCPSNTENHCTGQQQSGFDWSGLDVGSFDSYAGFSFNDFSCSNNWLKRDLVGKRGLFQDKCIKGSLSQGSGPSISCGSDQKGFSIDSYQISVDVDVDVLFLYTMEDGSSCQHVSSCHSGGSIIKNSQCGGAKSVSFQLPHGSKHSSCQLGIHSVGFNCNSSPPSSPATSSSPASTAPPAQSSVAQTTSSAKPPLPIASSSSAPSPPSPPAPPAQCPDVLPKCLNTWLSLTSCKSNSDYECFCKDSDFTAQVSECISAWGADNSIDIQAAFTYFIGLCAPYVPQNPGIVTNCPSTVTIGPTAAPSGGVDRTTVVVDTTVTTCSAGQTITGPSGSPTVHSTDVVSTIYVTSTSTICTRCQQPTAVPVTTITVSAVATVPATYATGVSAGLTIPSSSVVTSISTCVTVPQVQLTTVPAKGSASASVGLGFGQPTVVPQVASSSAPLVASSAGPKVTGGFGTTYVPKPTTSSGTSPAMFTGAAAALNRESFLGAAVAGGLMLLAL